MAESIVRMSVDQSQTLLNNVLGDEKLAEAIHNAKLLLVGCGGIGCEVIKNLMLIGFHDVTMIDLDTIDVSNLNRQFLFNKTHINQSKAQISASVAKQLFAHTDQVRLTPIHGSIQSADYNVDFFRQFTIVVNALDNRQARTHVNRMCLAADVPLIESGSEGYFGQTFVIKKNVSMCYECDGPKQDGRTFASCTIRNTPSLPIHCIVWAKHLFAQLFGEEDADNDVSPDMNDPELNEQANNKENGGSNNEGGDSVPVVPSTRKWAQNNDYDAELLFDKLFRADIEYLHTMDKLWKNRTKPCVLKHNDLAACDAGTSASVTITNGDQTLKEQRMWSLEECFQVFAQSVRDLRDRLKSESFLVWDKDDENALNFVTSVSNLRSHCFHIERKSKFDVKSMAGNIIPAISSTNSIVGGLMVLQIINLLRKLQDMQPENLSNADAVQQAYQSVCKHVYLRQISTKYGNLIAPYQVFPPNPMCLVCNTKHIPEIEVALDFTQVTMCEFVEQLLLKRLNFVCPDIQLDGQPIIIWSKDDADEYTEIEAANYRSNPLRSYSSIQNRTRLRVDDLIQSLTMIITLADRPIKVNENNGLFYDLKIIREADGADSPTDTVEPKDSAQAEESDEQLKSETNGVEIVVENGICPISSSGVTANSNGSTGKVKTDDIVELSDEDDNQPSTTTNVSIHHDQMDEDAVITLDDQESSNDDGCSESAEVDVIEDDANDEIDDNDCEIIEPSVASPDAKENPNGEDEVQVIGRSDEKRKTLAETPEEPQPNKKIRIN